MRPDYDYIRELEHEVEIGLPHEECWDCGTANLATPLPRLRVPIVEMSGGMRVTRYVHQRHIEMKRQLTKRGDALIRAAK